MRRIVVVLVSMLGLQGCAHGGRSSTVVLREETTGIVVSGEGRVEAAPDEALVQLGVEARGATVEEARQKAARAQTGLIDALLGEGVEQRDIQTSRLSVAPDYEYTEKGRNLLGYVVANMVQVRLRALQRIGPTLDAALAAGGDVVRLDGITFRLSDPEAVEAQAREEAIAQARQRAQQVANALGVTLGEAIAIEEAPGQGPPRPVMMRLEAADAQATTPVEPGAVEVRVELRVRWLID